jgi:ABC-type transport system involved in cytochrome bd biosynthesis fused ATPase/permease subunit
MSDTLEENPLSAEIQQARSLALSGATNQEIAQLLGVDLPTLQAKYGDDISETRAKRRVALRKKQTEVALQGASNLLMFLGKHELGQNDRKTDDDWPEPQLDPKVG